MTRPDPILRWFDDETFFSLCSRQHQFLGHLDTSSTLEWLFGSSPRSISHDFPSNLSSLDPRVTALWGEPTSIIYDHTILPLLIPFQCRDRIDNAVLAMKSPAIGSMKYSLGLVTGRFGAEHPLKACTSCMREDRLTLGVAYWHLTHQYPGVVLCPAHEVLLKECIENRQWSGRFKWVLPSEELLLDSSLPSPSDAAVNVLRRISQAVLELASYGKSRCFDPTIANMVYKDEIDRLGTSTEVMAHIATSFAEYASLINTYQPFNSLPSSQAKASAFLAQMSRKARGYSHPLKHLVMITWLFGQLSRFIEAYDQRGETEQLSLNGTAGVKKVHQPPCSGKPIALNKRKPQKPRTAGRGAFLESLESGEAKDKICSRFNISIATLNRVLSSDPLLKSLREKKLNQENLEKYREQWIGAANQNSYMCTNELRTRLPSVYAWLYRNDRNWLLEKNSHLPCGRKGNYSHTDWEARDIELRDLVNSKLIHTYGECEQLKISKSFLYSLVPSLSRLLEKRTRYPKTRLLLKGLLEGATA
jgi:hypothetical protein